MIIYMYSTCTGHTVLYYSYQADHINILCIIITTIITIYTVGIVLLLKLTYRYLTQQINKNKKIIKKLFHRNCYTVTEQRSLWFF
jgi:hypothetical protein